MDTPRLDPLTVRGFLRPQREPRPTPFVEIDEMRVSRNIARMQARADSAGVALRPHIKTHKSVMLAQRQLAAGAAGVTASKPSEALVFVEAGVPSVTLAYPIVRPESLTALLEAARQRNTSIFTIAADPAGVAALAAAAQRCGVSVRVFVKVDVGLGRIGVRADGPAAESVTARILAQPGLTFAGLLSHAGHAYAAANVADLARIAGEEAQMLAALAQRLRRGGIAVPAISVGATPTCAGVPIPPGVTEIRPGNYVFFDGTALRLRVCEPDDIALAVVCRVVFVNDRYAIVDAGSKVLSSDLGPHSTGGSGYGTAVAADPGAFADFWTVERLSEEHGFVRHNGTPPPVGSLLRIFPNHACSVVALAGSCDLVTPDGTSSTLAVDARGCVT